jgi:hypothetical protein
MSVINERYADCILVSREGTRYHSLQGILTATSPLFHDMFELSGPSTARGDGQTPEGSPSIRPVELKLDDSDLELRALTDHLHRVRSIIVDISAPDACIDDEAVQRLTCLTRVAFKYDMQGAEEHTSSYPRSCDESIPRIHNEDLKTVILQLPSFLMTFMLVQGVP